MRIAPCRNCKERKYLCHSSCEKYIKFQETKEMIKQKKIEEQNISNAIVDSIDRLNKAIKNGKYTRKSKA